MRKFLPPLLLVLLCVLAAPRAEAQVRFGAQGSWADDVDFGVGGRVVFGLNNIIKGTPLEGTASFDYYFPDGPLTYWEINGNVLYAIPGVKGSLAPYVGGGLNVAHASVDLNIPGISGASNTDIGLNIVGGTKFGMQGKRLAPFAEVKFELGGGEQFVLTGGVLF